MTVRTRIAPSPTGDPHVGTAYISLFNYAFGGTWWPIRFTDRDTDQGVQRRSEEDILGPLDWSELGRGPT